MEQWAATHDLRLANIGNTPTCVRPQGSSIVDLTWDSSGIIGQVNDWQVREDMETLSDHAYITFSVGGPFLPYKSGKVQRRWNWFKLDRTAFELSLVWSCHREPGAEEQQQLSARDSAL